MGIADCIWQFQKQRESSKSSIPMSISDWWKTRSLRGVKWLPWDHTVWVAEPKDEQTVGCHWQGGLHSVNISVQASLGLHSLLPVLAYLSCCFSRLRVYDQLCTPNCHSATFWRICQKNCKGLTQLSRHLPVNFSGKWAKNISWHCQLHPLPGLFGRVEFRQIIS